MTNVNTLTAKQLKWRYRLRWVWCNI